MVIRQTTSASRFLSILRVPPRRERKKRETTRNVENTRLYRLSREKEVRRRWSVFEFRGIIASRRRKRWLVDERNGDTRAEEKRRPPQDRFKQR